MSRIVASLVYSRQVGSMARKAILAYFAERANDDGSYIWASKQRIADEIECSKPTVISTVKGLIADGLLKEAGRHKTANGYTIIYDIVLSAVEALPEAKKSGQEVQNPTGQDFDRSSDLTPRGKAALPKPSCNRPSQKTSSSSKARARKSTTEPFVLPDWVPAEAWAGWIEMRQRAGKAPTDRAMQLAIGKLKELADDGHPPGDVLDQSTLRQWTGFFPIKDNRHEQYRDTFGSSSQRPQHGSEGMGKTVLAARCAIARLPGHEIG
jgi:hypothetical protein